MIVEAGGSSQDVTTGTVRDLATRWLAVARPSLSVNTKSSDRCGAACPDRLDTSLMDGQSDRSAFPSIRSSAALGIKMRRPILT